MAKLYGYEKNTKLGLWLKPAGVFPGQRPDGSIVPTFNLSLVTFEREDEDEIVVSMQDMQHVHVKKDDIGFIGEPSTIERPEPKKLVRV